jgi:hypothetical protein
MVMTALSLILATAQNHHVRMGDYAKGKLTFEKIFVYWV